MTAFVGFYRSVVGVNSRGKGSEQCGAVDGQPVEPVRAVVSRLGLGTGDGRRFWWSRRWRGVWDQAMAGNRVAAILSQRYWSRGRGGCWHHRAENTDTFSHRYGQLPRTGRGTRSIQNHTRGQKCGPAFLHEPASGLCSLGPTGRLHVHPGRPTDYRTFRASPGSHPAR